MSAPRAKEIALDLASRLQEADRLGSHYRKNLRNIEAYLPLLLRRLDENDALSLFDFHSISPFCYEEMELIRRLAPDDEEVLGLLGCYYSLHLITLNLNLLEALGTGPSSPAGRTHRCKTMLLWSEAEFSRLYSALIRTFVDVLRDPENPLPEFVLCHVGARRDQDDIDVGIVHRPGGDLHVLNRVIGRLNREMYRRATQMHFYLSEHSGSQWFSGSIEDYERLMDLNLKNFVIITQLFGAVPMIGSIALFEEFRERVIERYTYREGLDNRYYQGFIRGVVEEIRSLVSHRIGAGEIVPKVDGLRLAKMIVSARRATLGILGGQFWKAFEILRERDALLQEEYGFLEEAVVFLESVRFLYQVIFVQEEGVRYTDPHCRSALDRVARLMGYGESRSRRPSTSLLRDYFRYSKRIRKVAGRFKEEFKKYVEFIRVFRGLAERDPHQDLPLPDANLATDYVGIMERFHLPLPWDEFVGFLEEEEAYGRRFFEDLDLLAGDRLRRTLSGYFDSMSRDMGTLLRFMLCFLQGSWRASLSRLEGHLISHFRESLARGRGGNRALFGLLMEEPRRARDLMRLLPAEAGLDVMVQARRSRFARKTGLFNTLAGAAFQYHYAGPLLRRKMQRLMRRGLVREGDLADPARLQAAAANVLDRAGSRAGLAARYEALEDSHDLGLLAFLLRSLERGRFAQAGFMDDYVRRLLGLALEEAGLRQAAVPFQGLGLYAAGGKARGEVFENDYDMFVLYDPGRMDGSALSQAVQRVHRELARLGNRPHHLIAEKAGRFAVPLEVLESRLDRGDPEDFIERAELLGSRRIAGGKGLHRAFCKRVIRGKVLAERDRLVRALVREFEDLHASGGTATRLDLKGGPGGLFDMTMIVSACKAFHGIYEARDDRALHLLGRRDPSHAGQYGALREARGFLADARGLLKVTAYTETIDPETDLGFASLLKGFSDPRAFVEKVKGEMERVRKICKALIGEISGRKGGRGR